MTWTIGDAPYPGAQGTHGARYKVGPLCAVPTCGRMADHAHHLWSKSYLPAKGGGGWDWVLVEGVVLPNLLPLCWQHHTDCTGDIGGYDAGIRYDPDTGCLFWVEKTERLDGIVGSSEQELLWGTSDAPKIRYPDAEVELCAECGRRKPRKRDPSLPMGPKRNKARWQMSVPQDEREDGYEAFSDLVSQVCEKRGRSENEVYYALSEALYEYLMGCHMDEFDGSGPCPTCGTEVVL